MSNITKKILICEKFDHFVPTGNGWAQGLFENGHEVYKLVYPDPTYNLSHLEEELDLVVLVGGIPTDESFFTDLHDFKNKYPHCIVASITDASPLPHYIDVNDYVDFWFCSTMSHDLAEEDFRKELDKSLYFIPLAADTSIFYNTDDALTYDFSFIGQFGEYGGHGYRHQDFYLYPFLKDKSLKSFCSGFGYEGTHYNNIAYKNLNSIYNKTKINLNFHYNHQKGEDGRFDFNTRVYDIAIAGNFQFSDHPKAKDIFGDSIPVVSKDDWVDAFYFYLNNPDERFSLSTKAQKICSDNHTWSARMKYLENVIWGVSK
tara:strand:+ start:12313 stop:13260 length:948 start_codon:yes stop_codon:yes gene_type:complete